MAPQLGDQCPNCYQVRTVVDRLRDELETVTADRNDAWAIINDAKTPKPKITKLQRDLDDARGEIVDLKAALEEANEEIMELRRAAAGHVAQNGRRR